MGCSAYLFLLSKIFAGNQYIQDNYLLEILNYNICSALQWMVRRWIRFHGKDEAIRLMNWNNSDPRFSLRVNTSKGYTRADLVKRLESLQVHYEESVMDEFVRIREGMQAVLQAGLLKDGMCAVQDESAGLVVSVVDPQPGDTIIDCCAAPGGKTLFMASRLSRQGKIRALDVNKGRLRILMDAAKQHSLDDMITDIHADLRLYAKETTAKYEKVLLDAPCSGLGVLSKTCVGKDSLKIWKN